MAKREQTDNYVSKVVKGSFHQGSISVFGRNSVGRQCVPNCIIAVVYTNIVPLQRWTTESLDKILYSGDHLYNITSKEHDFLQVNEIEKNICAFHQKFTLNIDEEFFGKIYHNTSDVGSTLEYSLGFMQNKSKLFKKLIFGIMVVGDTKGGASSLLCVSGRKCYVFDPHSCDSSGLTASNGTSVMLHFATLKNMVYYLRCKYNTYIADLYNLTLVTCQPSESQLEMYFKDQKKKSSQMENEKRKGREISNGNSQKNRKKTFQHEQLSTVSSVQEDFVQHHSNMKCTQLKLINRQKSKNNLRRQQCKNTNRSSNTKLKCQSQQNKSFIGQKRQGFAQTESVIQSVIENDTNVESTCLPESTANNNVNRRKCGLVFDHERNTNMKSVRKFNEKKTNNSNHRKRKGQVDGNKNITKKQKRFQIWPELNTSRHNSLVVNLEQHNGPLTRNNAKQLDLKRKQEKNQNWESKRDRRIKYKRRNSKKRYEVNKAKQKKYQSSQKNQMKKNKIENRKHSKLSYSLLVDKVTSFRRRRLLDSLKKMQKKCLFKSKKTKTDEYYMKIFNNKTSHGPIYVCCVCLQTWFRPSVVELKKIIMKTDEEKHAFSKSYVGYLSCNNKEWLCKTCRQAIKIGHIPKLSIANKMGFPKVPPELNIFLMEERFLSPRLLFLQLTCHHVGGRAFARGNVVNVPIDVVQTVQMLPRSYSNTETISIKFKRRMQYQKTEFHENVRPLAVWKGIHYLLQNSELYKEMGIKLDTMWLEKQNSIQYSDETNTIFIDNEVERDTDAQCTMEAQKSDQLVDNNASIDQNSLFEEIDENDCEASGIVDRDTMLDEPTVYPKEFTFAPGEGKKPLSIFEDENVEYLAFPTIFCGQKREKGDIPVSYSDICKYELRSVDRRVAKHVPNMFFKLKKIQMKSITGTVGLAMRRCQSKGKKIRACDVLNDEKRANMVRLDEGHYIFRDIRNSPAYLAKRKKDVFAMIRQIGFPSLFISQSAAETKWPELLKALGKTVHDKDYTDYDIQNMDYKTKCELIQSDSPTLVRYFDHRFGVFLKDVLMSPWHPIGEITDYFIRKEFATRGAIHVHWLAYLKNAPIYGESSNSEFAEFYDKIISCSSNVPQQYKEYVLYQFHKHSKSCRVGKLRKCRFNFPRPPMPATCVLDPFSIEDQEKVIHGKEIWKKISNLLDEYGLGINVTDTFEEMLTKLNISHDEYLLGVRSTLVRSQFFLVRKPCEIRINNYMKNCLHIWRANHDIQPSLNPYAMVEYILSYVTKGQKGMSKLMQQACDEAKSGNMDLKQSVRHIGNTFLNCVETSQEEAAFLLLQLEMTHMSRECVHINTAPEDRRIFLVKDMETLKKMDPESTQIKSNSIIEYYKTRPKIFENYSLAEFASKIRIIHALKGKCRNENLESDQDDEKYCSQSKPEEGNNIESTMYISRNGTVYKQRAKDRIIRYVGYSKSKDTDNYFREKLMLFYPWRHEENDLKPEGQTYEQFYKLNSSIIKQVQKKYEHYNDILLDAIETTESAECRNSDYCDDDVETNVISNYDKYAFFDPDREDNLVNYDIADDIHCKEFGKGNISKAMRYETEVDCSGHKMTNDQYICAMRSLNKNQYELCIHVMHQIECEADQMCIFLEGSGGVGKTHLARAICETVARYYNKKAGQSNDSEHVLILTPTGMAAFHIKGTTIHSGLHIPINQKKMDRLSHAERNKLFSKYINVKLILFDEISMIGCRLFNKANDRLQDIFDSKKPFGGKHVIAIGDFYQMRPVKDIYIFKNPETDYQPLAMNLWTNYFYIFSLTEIMRQQEEKEFCAVLNRLRKAECTDEDNRLFESRTVDVSSSQYNRNIRHIYPFRSITAEHNKSIFEYSSSEKITIHAKDTICNNPSNEELAKCLLAMQTSKQYEIVFGLHRTINIAVGLTYCISCNVNTHDGLINGAICMVEKIQYIEKHSREIPSILWVTFTDSEIGQCQRQKYEKFFHDDINYKWTPIFVEKREMFVRNGKAIREQFPLMPAAATTIHKCQGSTLPAVCIDMDILNSPKMSRNPERAKAFYQHAHYVAASRVKSLYGLHIISWNPELISVNKDVQEHLEYMNTKKQLKLCYIPTYQLDRKYVCAYLNTRSLHNHFHDVRANRNLIDCNLIILSETRLCGADNDKDYNIPGFTKMYRNDAIHKGYNRPAHGLIMYVKCGIQVLEVQKYSDLYFEAIYICICQAGEEKPEQIVGLYISPKITWNLFEHHFNKFMKQIDTTSTNTTIIGDFNMKSVISGEKYYNEKVCNKMFLEYNMKQYVSESTTSDGSILDLCFSTHDVTTTCLWNHWSDHKIVGVGIE